MSAKPSGRRAPGKAQAKAQSGGQAGRRAGAQASPFDALLARAEALAKGDDAGLKALVADLLGAEFSDERCDPILRAAARVTGIGLKIAKDLAARARVELKRRAEATPAAHKAKLLVQEAQAKAAQAERDAEIARLWASCKDLAEDEHVLAKMGVASQRAGMVGEEQSIRAICLSMVSRLLRDGGVNLLRRGAPAGGKNFLVSTAMALMPPESMIVLSGSSPTGLIYFGDDENALRHKLIIVAEAAAIAAKGNGDEHPVTILLRTLLSEGHIDRLVTVPQPNGLPKSIHVRRHGPVVAVLTSAREDVDEELFTRLMPCDVDEGGEQTKAIVARKLEQGSRVDPLTPEEIERWRDLQRWLEAGAPYDVEIPFLKALHKTWLALVDKRPAALQLRLRRDIGGLLAAIKASAVLHRANRQKNSRKIVAEIADYEHAWRAFHPGLSAVYGMQIRPEIIAVIKAAENLGVPLHSDPSPPESIKLTAAMLCKEIGINSKKTAINRIQEAIERGVLKEDDARRGRSRGSPHYFWLVRKSSDLESASKQQNEPAVFPSPAEVEKDWKGEGGAGEQRQEEQKEQKTATVAEAEPSSRSSRSSCLGNSIPSPPFIHFCVETRKSAEMARIPRVWRREKKSPQFVGRAERSRFGRMGSASTRICASSLATLSACSSTRSPSITMQSSRS
jgi:hypothetical protein